MANGRQADDAFLAELRAFLGGSEASSTSEEEIHTQERTRDNDLLLISNQLLSETENLLSTLEPPKTAKTLSEPDTNVEDKLSTRNCSGSKKRGIQSLLAANRRNRYRQRLKDEKQLLLQQEQELSTKLSQLEAANTENQKKAADSMALSVWRAIAKRQMEKRQEVEQLQKSLRAAVINRARLVHQMKALIRKPPLCVDNHPPTLGSDKSDGSAVIKNYLKELNGLYAQTDNVFHDVEFKVSTSMAYSPKRTVKQGVEYLESADSTVIPFDYGQAAEAFSTMMLSDQGMIRCDGAIDDPENTVAAKYNIHFRDQAGNDTLLVGYTASRRYNEPSRVVFVWRTLTEGQDEFAGCNADETGWAVVRPFDWPVSSKSNGKPASVIESYVRVVPATLDGVSGDLGRADRFNMLLIKSGEEEVKEMTRMMERLLLASS